MATGINGKTAELLPGAAGRPRLHIADGRLAVDGGTAGPGLGFIVGRGREEALLLTRYRTRIHRRGHGEQEYTGVMLRSVQGPALAWLSNDPADAPSYRSEDLARFSGQAGLQHDELLLDQAALLRLTAHAERLGPGTGRVNRAATGLSQLAGLSIVLGPVALFLVLALAVIPHPTSSAGPIAAVAASFVVLIFGLSALGWWLTTVGAAAGNRRAGWLIGTAIFLALALVFAVSGLAVEPLGRLGSFLIPLGIGLWSLGVLGVQWSQGALQPRDPLGPAQAPA